jgi:hypothetical protein
MALVTEAVLAVLIPVGLMAGALALQRFEYHLLGPAPHADDDGLRPARPPSRPSSVEESQASSPHL